MISIQVTLVALFEKPEKLLGPEWRNEGCAELLRPNRGVVLHAEADQEEDSRPGAPPGSRVEPKACIEKEILDPAPIVSETTLRVTATRIMLALFASSVGATFAIILGYGLGYLKYPDWFLKWLGVVTIGEIATFLGYILKYLFPQTVKNKRKK
jgi:hypothetical protein